MNYSRPPHPALRPFIKTLWVSTQATLLRAPSREHVIPTGDMHLVFRLTPEPLRIFNGAQDTGGKRYSPAVIGGPRASFYCKEIGVPVHTVGVQLYPGVADYLFGASAAELAECHTNLDGVWGYRAELARDALLAAGDAEQQLCVLETLLSRYLPSTSQLHPAVAFALREFRLHADIGQVVERTGYSHRHFSALFRRATGLTPKLYCRVQRLQQVLALPIGLSLTQKALVAGYSDQAHLQREFREFTGMTPAVWRKAAPEFSHHVQVNFIQDRPQDTA